MRRAARLRAAPRHPPRHATCISRIDLGLARRRRLRRRQLELLQLQEQIGRLFLLRSQLGATSPISLGEISASALDACKKSIEMHQELRSELGSLPMLF